ncbi:hypothetical protein KKB64_03930 [Patescibacteria group bacterium]|nr:hypothetical protein [Patescibacteria group bacterium]MBU1472907.1 hypothetical protein [Patescibacteria group bacterium]MBU2460317.1 hypothetical protein [Patescibacteria group bacterium]
MKKKRLVTGEGGFSLMELLVVIVILVLLFILTVMNWKNQVNKGYDGRRKSDLGNVRSALEEYYNDRECYPATLGSCGGNTLDPYLPATPCDPRRNIPYLYTSASGDWCKDYVLCAALDNTGDGDITSKGCNPITGCGWGAGYNYCIASGTTAVAEGFDAAIMPTPTPTPTPGAPTPTPTPAPGGNYACTPGGACNSYGIPMIWLCPKTFVAANCNDECSNPAVRCPI